MPVDQDLGASSFLTPSPSFSPAVSLLSLRPLAEQMRVGGGGESPL